MYSLTFGVRRYAHAAADRHTDRQRHVTNIYISRRLRLTRNVNNKSQVTKIRQTSNYKEVLLVSTVR